MNVTVLVLLSLPQFCGAMDYGHAQQEIIAWQKQIARGKFEISQQRPPQQPAPVICLDAHKLGMKPPYLPTHSARSSRVREQQQFNPRYIHNHPAMHKQRHR
jgi:hypothetical protein